MGKSRPAAAKHGQGSTDHAKRRLRREEEELENACMLVFGYAYPAYDCYKTVELNKPEIDQLIIWCQYWLPFYSEAKLLFFIYLWYPRTKHENEIDRNLLEFRARANDVVVVYVQKVAAVGQNTFFDVLKYVASQSPSQKSKQQRSQVKQDDISGSHDICDA
ncbi:hypothetical protein ZWY2020_035783 [Hordeum vulgare]|nr:hypothetical protein ZWY2020_035783 [Hordeum vulgare]